MPPNLSQYQELISAFIVSVIASFIRLMFYKGLTFKCTVSNFLGGVALGSLLGYLLRDNGNLGFWKEILISLSALLGKELTDGVIKIMPGIVSMVPEFLKMFLNNYLNKKNDDK